MKRILIISQNFWPESFPINNVALEISKTHEIDILTGKPNYPYGLIFNGYTKFTTQKEKFGRKTYIYRVPIIPRFAANNLNLILNYLSFVISSITLGTFLLWGKKYEHIFVYCPSPITQILVGIYFKLIKKAKLYTWVQDIWPESAYAIIPQKKNILFKLLKYICNHIYSFNNKLFLQSDAFKKYFSLNQKKIKQIYLPNPGIEINFNIKYRNKKFPFNKKKLNILYTGNIGRAQNFDNLLNSLGKIEKINRNIDFHFIGAGSYKKKAISISKVKKISNLKFYNFMSYKKLINYIKSADILLIMLKNDPILNITVPSKFQNYLATNKPILSFSKGETNRLINKIKAGYICKPDDTKGFVKLVLKLYKLKNSKVLKLKAKNGFLYYKKNYHIRIIKNKILENMN